MTMFKRALYMCLWMTSITGLAYPLLITFIAQFTMPFQANGSLISINQAIVGSHLIGQKFTSDKYFWGRPSASDYNPLKSGGSNLGPISAILKDLVQTRKRHLQRAHSMNPSDQIPGDLLFASGSGLDPHITLEAAHYQKMRIAKTRGFNREKIERLEALMESMIEQKRMKLIGRPCLNVLKLNIALDELTQPTAHKP